MGINKIYAELDHSRLEFVLKKLILLIALLYVCTGCSSYRLAHHKISPTKDLVVKSSGGDLLTESELIGNHCQIKLLGGSTVEGEIIAIDQQSVSLGNKGKNSSALENDNSFATVVTIVKKTEIYELKLKSPAGFKTLLLISGLSIIGYYTALLVALANYGWN